MPGLGAGDKYHSRWGSLDSAQDSGFYVRFLDQSRQGQLARIRKDPGRELAFLSLKPGLHLLDVGCGLGDLTREYAKVVGRKGRVTGVDSNQVMIDEATRRTKGSGISVEFTRGDLFDLHVLFPKERFDRTVATTLLQHLPTPRTREAIAEMARVTGPNGLVAVSDQDWGSHVISTGRPEVDVKLQEFFTSGIASRFVAREIPVLMRQCGLQDIVVSPETVAVTGSGEQGIFSTLDDCLEKARLANVLTAEEAAEARRSIRYRESHGLMFEAVTFFRVVGRVPTR